MNIIKTKVKPESPNVIPGAQYHIYAPIVSRNHAGLAQFDPYHFTVDQYGVVRFNDSYITEKVGCVRLNPEDNTKIQVVNSPLKVDYLKSERFVESEFANFNKAVVTSSIKVGSIYIDASNAEKPGIQTPNLTVTRDLTVLGVVKSVSQETVTVEDNLLVLNSGGEPFDNAGLAIKVDIEPDDNGKCYAYGILYDDNDSTLKLGYGSLSYPTEDSDGYTFDPAIDEVTNESSMLPIATRVGFNADYNKYVPVWNNSRHTFYPSLLNFETPNQDDSNPNNYLEQLVYCSPDHLSRFAAVFDNVRAGASIVAGSEHDFGKFNPHKGLRDGTSALGSRIKIQNPTGISYRFAARGWDLTVTGSDVVLDGKFNEPVANFSYCFANGYDSDNLYNSYAVDFSGNLHIGNKAYVYEIPRKRGSGKVGANYTGTKYQLLSKSPTDQEYIKSIAALSSLSWKTSKPSTGIWILNRLSLYIQLDYTSNGVSNNFTSQSLTTFSKGTGLLSEEFTVRYRFESDLDIKGTIKYTYFIDVIGHYAYYESKFYYKVYAIHENGMTEISYLNPTVNVYDVEYLC